MFQKITSAKSSAFTLIELLIVIGIISLIGIFAFSKMAANQKAKITDNVEKIKDVFNESDGNVQLLCLEKTTECYIFGRGAKVIRKLSNPIGDMQAYILDDSDNPEQLKFGRYKNRPISLRMKHFANGSTSQMIIKSGDNFYFVPSYLGEVKKFDAIDDAVELWLDGNEMYEEGGYYR